MTGITIRTFWQEMQADYSNCFVCGNLIKEKMYQLVADIAGEEKKLVYKICEQCKTKMDGNGNNN